MRGKLNASHSLAGTSLFWSLAEQRIMYPGFQRTALTSVAQAVGLNLQVLGQAQASCQKQTAPVAPAWADSPLESSLEEMNKSIPQEVLGFLRPEDSLGDGAGPLPPDDSPCLPSQCRLCQQTGAGRLDVAVHSPPECFPAPKPLETESFLKMHITTSC